MTYEILTQGIGFLALACFVASFQIKSNKTLLLMQIAGSMLFGTQYLLLGSVTGFLNVALAIFRNILIYHYDDWKWVPWKGWIGVIGLCSTVILIFTWQGISSILSMVALMGGTVGYWSNNARNIRICNLVVVSPAWLTFSVLIGSIGGILNELLVMSSVLISIYRYGWKNLGNPDFGKNKTKE